MDYSTTEQMIYHELHLPTENNVDRAAEARKQVDARQAFARVDSAINTIRSRVTHRRRKVASANMTFIDASRKLATRPETDCVALLALVITTHIQAGYQPDPALYFKRCTLALPRFASARKAHL